MSRIAIALGTLVAVSAVFCAGAAQAQLGKSLIRNPGAANPRIFTQRYLLDQPTVSPYLNLLRDDRGVGLPNYQALVKPRLEQRERERRQRANMNRMQQQVNTMQSDLRREAPIHTTGHPTRFMNYSHYYPTLGR